MTHCTRGFSLKTEFAAGEFGLEDLLRPMIQIRWEDQGCQRVQGSPWPLLPHVPCWLPATRPPRPPWGCTSGLSAGGRVSCLTASRGRSGLPRPVPPSRRSGALRQKPCRRLRVAVTPPCPPPIPGWQPCPAGGAARMPKSGTQIRKPGLLRGRVGGGAQLALRSLPVWVPGLAGGHGACCCLL